MSKTLKSVLESKRKSRFIGRDRLIGLLTDYIAENDSFRIFNIYGQGGVGKTFLCNEYIDIIQANACLSVYTDENVESVLHWMEKVSLELKKHNRDLSDFDKRYKTYRQEIHTLEADEQKPRGLFSSMAVSLTKAALDETKKIIPGSTFIEPYVNVDATAKHVGKWADFVYRKITNKDEVELVLDPLKVLTPIFFKDIQKYAGQYKFVCFFFDTYEATSKTIESWLLDVVGCVKYGDVAPGNMLLIIAGRDKLDNNKWGRLFEFTENIPLDRFTPQEANEYLDIKGIADQKVRDTIMSFSGRLPALMAVLTQNAQSNIDGDVCDTAVDLFLKWVDDGEKRAAALATAIPRKFNEDVLTALLPGNEKGAELFSWLCTQAFVQKRGDSWVYYTVVRDQILRYQRSRSPRNWIGYHKSLSHYYEGLQAGLAISDDRRFLHDKWIEYKQEQLYHKLCVNPDNALSVAVGAVVESWYENGLFHHRSDGFIESISSAAVDAAHAAMAQFSKDMVGALQHAKKENLYQALMPCLERILASDWKFRDELNVFLHFMLAACDSNTDKATELYQKVIALDPQCEEALVNLANIYYYNEEYDRAISLYQRAIQLNVDSTTYYNLGNAYADKGDYDNAIKTFLNAYELNPNDVNVLCGLAREYFIREAYDQALDVLIKANQVKPNDETILHTLGSTHANKKQYSEAIKIYNQVIGLNPEKVETYWSLGCAYFNVGYFEQALVAFRKTTALQQDHVDAILGQAKVHMRRRNYEQAMITYERVIDLQPDNTSAIRGQANLYLFEGRHEKAIATYQRILDLDPADVDAILGQVDACVEIGDYIRSATLCQRAVALEPENVNVIMHQIGLFAVTGHADQAIETYQRAHEVLSRHMEANPDQEELYKSLEILEKCVTICKERANVQGDSHS